MTTSYALAATRVLEIVRKRMIHGAMNQVGGLRPNTMEAHSKAYGAASPLLSQWKGSYFRPYYLKLADAAWEHRGGQCDAQSHIAALLLASCGAFPVDVMAVSIEIKEQRNGRRSTTSTAHAFAVTGRPELSEQSLQDPKSWGNAYVCDPWQGFAYPGKILKERLWCGDDIRKGDRSYSHPPGDPKSFCSDPERIESLSVELRLQSENDLPADLLKSWRTRLE